MSSRITARSRTRLGNLRCVESSNMMMLSAMRGRVEVSRSAGLLWLTATRVNPRYSRVRSMRLECDKVATYVAGGALRQIL